MINLNDFLQTLVNDKKITEKQMYSVLAVVEHLETVLEEKDRIIESLEKQLQELKSN